MQKFSKEYECFRKNCISRGIHFTGSFSRHLKYFHIGNFINRIMIFERIREIKSKLPSGIPAIKYISKTSGDFIGVNIEHVHGSTDLKKYPTEFLTLLQSLLTDWDLKKFVHGDLSPANLVFDGSNLWAIDWSENLSKPSGTPKYSTIDTLRFKHSTNRNHISAAIIANEFIDKKCL